MATYAIGDVQGCYRELQDLLDLINFDAGNDRLWFTGDLINRGPASLETLRFVRKMGALSVFGNHEFHLLAINSGATRSGKKDTLGPVLDASDRKELMQWISCLPLLHHDPDLDYVMTHAGLPPQWDLEQAREMAAEVESVLQSDQLDDFLDHLYGNTPDIWDENLTGWDRLRYTVNALTRMRYCNHEGRLDFNDKGPPGIQSTRHHPWFVHEQRRSRNNRIIFGHWASLYRDNATDFMRYGVYPLDTGCVWGRKLTAMRLEDQRFFDVPSRQR